MSEPKVKKIKLSELIPDPQNANKGTERGRYMLEHSISTLGAGRSVLVDKNNVLIAGNKTTSVAYESGFENAILVETDGTELVVVRRTDLDLTTDSRAKQLAIADNVIGKINLDLDAEIILELDKEIDLSAFFTDDELNQLSLSLDDDGEGGDGGSSGDNDTTPEIVESRVKLGDVWQLGRHFIACCDCTVEENVRQLLSFVGGRSPDMVFSDPPYGINIVATNVTVGGGEAYDIPFGGVKNREKGYVGGVTAAAHQSKNADGEKNRAKKAKGLTPPMEPSPSAQKNPILLAPIEPVISSLLINMLQSLVMTA